MANLVSLCSFHHQLLHEGGWSVTRELVDGGDERFVFRDRHGRVRAAQHPRQPALPNLSATTGQLPTDADSRANLGWNGERPDYSWIVSALCG